MSSAAILFQFNLQHGHGSQLESVGLQPHRYVVIMFNFTLTDTYECLKVMI